MSCENCPSKGNCSKDASSCQFQPNPHNKIKHIIAVMSGKGGVGKSTVTVLLARALRQMGKSVGIMDADITGPSIPRLMGLEKEQAYANPEGEILPVTGEDQIGIVSLNYLLPDENEPVIWRGPVISGIVQQFYKDVYWGTLDYLLIDMPPGTGDVALTILQDLPVTGVLMVSSPQPMVSMIVTKAIRMCEKMNIRVLGVIENMAYLNCPHCHEKILFYDEDELQEFIKNTNTKLYGTLPQLDLLRNLNKYETYTLKEQEQVQEYFKDIAEDLQQDIEKGAEPSMEA